MQRISRFSPNWSDPDTLEAITVAREDLISTTVDAVRESSLTKNKHHRLFVGPRGSGKTHLVTLVHHRVTAMDDVMENLRIAWLNEDETSDTLLSLLLRIHRALAKEYPREFPADSTEAIYDLSEIGEASEAMTDLLLKQLGEQTLLVLVENLDAVFAEFDEGEQKRWRALIQNHPQFCTVATAQRLFTGVSDRDAPFFGFFDVNHLKPFSVENAAELLTKVARKKKDTELARFIASPRGRARLRALHHLTGGNQRLFIILSEFIERESLESLVGPFEELVDEQLTPYYQERLRWLSTLQRKIVEFLCSVAKPQSVKEIARKLFASSQTISSQLGKLREMHYVQSRQRGRESLYELAEPLMRLSHEVKEAKGRTPLRILVDFLRVWYDREELQRRLEITPADAAITRLYFSEAGKQSETSGNLRLQMFREEAAGLDLTHCSEQELALLCDLKEESNHPADIINYGLAMGHFGRHDEAAEAFSTVIERGDVSTDLIAWAFLTRGTLNLQQGDIDMAITDYTHAIERDDTTNFRAALALVIRGLAYWQRGDSEMAIADHTAVIQLENSPPELFARALVSRGLFYRKYGDTEAAITDLTKAIKFKDAPPDQKSRAHFNAALIELDRGSWAEAEHHLRSGFAQVDRVDSDIVVTIPEYLSALLNSGQTRKTWKPRADALISIYEENKALIWLGSGLVASLAELRNSSLSPKGLSEWHAVWAEQADTHPELELPSRLLRTAINYFAANEDKNVLLDLPAEEREILIQALGLESQETDPDEG